MTRSYPLPADKFLFFDRIRALFPVLSSKFPRNSEANQTGEVPERSIGNAWKAFVPLTGYRGFESLPLRQLFIWRALIFHGAQVLSMTVR